MLHVGLLDELLLFVHPVVLGEGRPLFDELHEPLACDLLEHATFEGGVTMMHYAIRHARPVIDRNRRQLSADLVPPEDPTPAFRGSGSTRGEVVSNGVIL
jgi:hypothetical protein